MDCAECERLRQEEGQATAEYGRADSERKALVATVGANRAKWSASRAQEWRRANDKVIKSRNRRNEATERREKHQSACPAHLNIGKHPQ